MKKYLSTKLKNNKAITLIALVITIVVLIILAGVIISITIGNGGIINRAKIAGQEYANAQGYEETQVAKYSNEINSYVDGNRNYEDEINNLKQRISDLENRNAIVDFNVPNIDIWTKVADYPSGYTRENCFIISSYFYINDDHQYVVMPFAHHNATNNNFVQLEQKTDGIYVLNTNSTYKSLAGKIYLQKK